jgi:hypothetical protein
MTLQSSGTISLSQVNTELGIAATTAISLNQANVRTLAGVPSGTIGMANLYGKSNNFTFNYTISGNVQNFNLFSEAEASGWNGVAPLVATITVGSGVVVGASSTGNYAFSTGTGFPSGSTLYLLNYGYIVGAGGQGGAGVQSGGAAYGPGGGGPAMYVQYPMTINNQGIIGGGGGGGGGGALAYYTVLSVNHYIGGGGGGGGAGWNAGAGGAGGTGTYAGGAGAAGSAPTGAGAGGAGATGDSKTSGAGGAGGTLGAAGGTGGSSGNAGAAGGYYAIGSGNISWAAVGSVYGPAG